MVWIWLASGGCAGGGGPEDVGVDGEVVVHDAVAHPDDLPPGHLGLAIGEVGGEPGGGFADDLDEVGEDDLEVLVGVEAVAAVLDPGADLGGGFEDVEESVAVTSRRS